jgi:hypothetical protein
VSSTPVHTLSSRHSHCIVRSQVPSTLYTLHAYILARLHGGRRAPHLINSCALTHAFCLARQTPHNPYGLCVSPQTTACSSGAGVAAPSYMYVSPSGESSKGTTARAWLGDACSFFPRPACKYAVIAVSTELHRSHPVCVPRAAVRHCDEIPVLKPRQARRDRNIVTPASPLQACAGHQRPRRRCSGM